MGPPPEQEAGRPGSSSIRPGAAYGVCWVCGSTDWVCVRPSVRRAGLAFGDGTTHRAAGPF